MGFAKGGKGKAGRSRAFSPLASYAANPYSGASTAALHTTEYAVYPKDFLNSTPSFMSAVERRISEEFRSRNSEFAMTRTEEMSRDQLRRSIVTPAERVQYRKYEVGALALEIRQQTRAKARIKDTLESVPEQDLAKRSAAAQFAREMTCTERRVARDAAHALTRKHLRVLRTLGAEAFPAELELSRTAELRAMREGREDDNHETAFGAAEGDDSAQESLSDAGELGLSQELDEESDFGADDYNLGDFDDDDGDDGGD